MLWQLRRVPEVISERSNDEVVLRVLAALDH